MPSEEEQFQAAVAAMEAEQEAPREEVSDGEEIRFRRIVRQELSKMLRGIADIIDMPEEDLIREGLKFERIINERKTFTPFQDVYRNLWHAYTDQPFRIDKQAAAHTHVSMKQLVRRLNQTKRYRADGSRNIYF